MRRAQQRDAVNQAKFFFRREIFTPASSRATSGATTPKDDNDNDSTALLPNGTSSSNAGRLRAAKHRVMPNCFPPPPAPTEAGVSVNEEYAEYTMNDIMNGRVSLKTFWLEAGCWILLNVI